MVTLLFVNIFFVLSRQAENLKLELAVLKVAGTDHNQE